MRIAINDRVLLPIFALVGCSMAMVLGFVWFSARQQDEIAIERSVAAADAAIEDQRRQIGMVAKDFSWRNDAVRHLDIAFSDSWAESNLGYYVHGQYDYDMSFVIDRDGETVFSHVDGRRIEREANKMLKGGLGRLISRAQQTPWENPEAVTGVMATDDGLVLVGLCAVAPKPGSNINMRPSDNRVVVVLAKRLTTDVIASITSTLDLQDVRLSQDPNHQSDGMLSLTAPDNSVIGELIWTPYQPGQQFLSLITPALGGAVLLILAITWLLIWQVRSSTRAIENSEARFRDVADASSDWIWEIDAKGRLQFLSPRFAETTGTTVKSMLGRPIHELLRPTGDKKKIEQLSRDIKEQRHFRNLLCHYVTGDSSQKKTLRVAGTPIFDVSNAFRGFRGTATDISKEIDDRKRIQHLAHHDSLTSLPNRETLRRRMAAAIKSLCDGDGKVAVLCLDLDRFKEINDTLGHSAGDLLIRGCAKRLRETVRGSDTVARIGGDEFSIIQIGLDQPEGAQQLCRRLLSAITKPYDLDGHEVLVTASIGVAIASDDRVTPERLLQKADIALYRAKEEGRNAYRLYETGMDAFLQQRKKLERDLRAALVRRELELFYQPKLELGTNKIFGAEALVRWRHPEQRLVMPDQFIGLAEETGLILGLGEWVLNTACAQAAKWPDLAISLNISPVQFKHHDLVSMVSRAIKETRVDPERIELEITEGVLLRNTEAAVTTLSQLKELGVQIVMDDFGTRYSGLSYLLKFPFDKIKIDQSFVRGVRSAHHADAIVRAVVGLGHSLGMRICAEGVETQEQLGFLRGEGCDEVQGYLVGEPMTVEQFEQGFIDDPHLDVEVFADLPEQRYIAAQ